MNVHLNFDLEQDVAAPYIATGVSPKVAVLREQGVNSAELTGRATFTPAALR